MLQSHPELIEMYKNQSRLEEARTISIRAKTSPLHAASRNGHRAVVDALLAAGFPVSLLTQTGTALHEAALCGKVDVVRRLLDAGIDVSLKDSRGFSALRIVQDLPTVVVQEITNLIQSKSQSFARWRLVFLIGFGRSRWRPVDRAERRRLGQLFSWKWHAVSISDFVLFTGIALRECVHIVIGSRRELRTRVANLSVVLRFHRSRFLHHVAPPPIQNVFFVVPFTV